MMDLNIVKRWEENKHKLEKFYEKNLKFFRQDAEYTDILKAVVEHVNNTEDKNFDIDNITVIDHGDYQGTILYIIPILRSQPSEDDYLVTYENYGSCSGCDALIAAQDLGNDKELVEDLMVLSLHLIQRMKYIYSQDE